jgi:hypothetical protein
LESHPKCENLEFKITSKTGIEVVFFLLITSVAESLQIADIVGATTSKGDNMICGKVGF